VAPIKERLPRGQLEPFPRREELEALVRYYHHLQNEHKRAALESAMRRRVEETLLEVRRGFDRVLEEWVPEEKLRHAWREHLHYRAPEPPGPPAIRPLVFRGVSEAGSVVEIRGTKGEELEVRSRSSRSGPATSSAWRAATGGSRASSPTATTSP
jgi:hypothetical protein